jgi:drug/metabolite transporter (DMT)-like permease
VGALLALLSSAVWGSADFGGGMLSRKMPPIAAVLYSQGFALIAVILVVAVTGSFHLAQALWWAVFAGIVGPLALTLYYRALSIGPMGVVGPVSSTSGLVPIVIGLALGEHLSLLRIVALIGAIIGVGAVSASHFAGFHRENMKVIALSLGAALGFGLAFVGLTQASSVTTFDVLLVQRTTNFLLMLPIALLSGTSLRVPRKNASLLAVVGVADVSANGLYTLSSTFGQLALVGALGSVYPLATAVLAAIFNHERLTPTQLGGAALVIVCVAIAAVG